MTNSRLTSVPQPATDSRRAFCERHGEFEQRVIAFPPLEGVKPIMSSCPQCHDERVAEREQLEREEAAAERASRAKLLLASAGIPKRFEGRTLATYEASTESQRRVLSICTQFASSDEGGSLVLCGPPGTGKTHLGCAMAAAFTQRGRSAKFITVIAAMRSIKDTYNRESRRTETEAISELITPDLLVLDEVGIQLRSETESRLVFELLNERYAACKATVVISNLDRAELRECLGDRIMDRFREGGAVLALDWQSRRGVAA